MAFASQPSVMVSHAALRATAPQGQRGQHPISRVGRFADLNLGTLDSLQTFFSDIAHAVSRGATEGGEGLQTGVVATGEAAPRMSRLPAASGRQR
jgi:hypothetical protein